MKYRAGRTKSFEKDLVKKLQKKDNNFKLKLKEKLMTIETEPPINEPLTGNWQGSNTYKCKFSNNPEFRILYQIQPCRSCGQITANSLACQEDADCIADIIFLYFKTREECNNLYKLAKKDIPIGEIETSDTSEPLNESNEQNTLL